VVTRGLPAAQRKRLPTLEHNSAISDTYRPRITLLYTHTALYRRTGNVLSLTPLILGFTVNAARGLSGAL
jgi:hypothetical protein